MSTLTAAREILTANLRKVAKLDVPFLYVDKASDDEPALLVGEANKALPGPLAAAVRKGAKTQPLSGFLSKPGTELVFRVGKGTINQTVTTNLRKLVADAKAGVLLAREGLVPEAKPDAETAEQEETASLRAAAKMMDPEAEKRDERLEGLTKSFESAKERILRVRESLKGVGLETLKGAVRAFDALGKELGKDDAADTDKNLDRIAAAVGRAENAADDLEDLAESVLALDLKLIERERTAEFKPAVAGWKKLGDQLAVFPVVPKDVNRAIADLDAISDLVDRTATLRRRIRWVESQVSAAEFDARNPKLQKFAARFNEDLRKIEKLGTGTLVASELDKLELWIAKKLDGVATLKPDEKPPAAGGTYTENPDGTLTYDGNTYQYIHVNVYGCIEPGHATGAVLKAYQAALDNGVIETYGTGDAGVKKKGSSWELKIRRDTSELLKLGTSRRMGSTVTSVPKVGGSGVVKFVLFNSWHDGH